MVFFRRQKQINQREILSEVFDDNLSIVLSENEEADDCMNRCAVNVL